MHPNPAFRRESRARAVAFARERGFGVVTLAGPEGPLASHIPFVLSEDGARLEAHVVRANPIWEALKGGEAEALMIVSGPDGYISPDWYGIADQVPTWNYVAAHLRGRLRLGDEAGLRAHLDRLSVGFERRLAPKPVWRADKMAPDALAKLMRAIAPVEMAVETVDATWKLNQNKPEAARLGAAGGVEAADLGADTGALAALMRGG